MDDADCPTNSVGSREPDRAEHWRSPSRNDCAVGTRTDELAYSVKPNHRMFARAIVWRPRVNSDTDSTKKERSLEENLRPPRIFVVLPALGRRPVGGFRVAYEYANRLAKSGCDVSVFHDVPSLGLFAERPDALNRIPNLLSRRHIRWFELSPEVRVRIGVPGRRARIRDAGCVSADGLANRAVGRKALSPGARRPSGVRL